MGVIRVRPLEDGGQRLRHAVRSERGAPSRRLPEGQQVRLQPPAPREPTRSTDLGVRLVDGQQRVVVTGRLAHRRVEPRLRLHDPDVGQRGFGQDTGHISWSQGCGERLRVIERHDANTVGGTGVKSQQLGDEPATAWGEQHLIGMTVVATVKHDHDRAARGHARQTHGFHIGGGGREGELPAGEVVPPSQLLGNPDRILRRQEELPAVRHAIRYRRDDRRRIEATEEAHVRQIEVEVAVAVGIGEVGAVAVDSEDWAMSIQIMEPAHRNPVRHRVPSPGVERERVRMRLGEALVFAFCEGSDTSGIHSNSSSA